MKLLIREFIPTDTSDFVAVTQQTQHPDPFPREMALTRRWIAKLDGQVVAFGEVAPLPQSASEYWLRFGVVPSQQNRGIGSTLYAHLADMLMPLRPRIIRVYVPEHSTAGARFVRERGFQPEAAGPAIGLTLWSKVVPIDYHPAWAGPLLATARVM